MIEISEEQAEALWKTTKDAWKDPNIPRVQWDVNKVEYLGLSKGEYKNVRPFVVAEDALKLIPDFQNKSILDVGASSAFYSEVFKLIGHKGVYRACDYSDAFRDFARKVYPNVAYDVEDAAHLSYAKASFDIVFHGCCLIHMMDWKAAIFEAAFVAKEYVVFHRTPLYKTSPTRYFTKDAYGVPCLEIHFGSFEFFDCLQRAGLKPIGTIENFSNDEYGGYGYYSVVCKK